MKRNREQLLARREFLSASVIAAAVWAMPPRWRGSAASIAGSPADDVTVVQFSDAGVRLGTARVPKVVRPDSEWQALLSPLAFAVTRHASTERPFSGAYWNLHEKGLFRCVCCDTALFSSAAKFDSGTGWPSFWEPIAAENVEGPRAKSRGADDSEVTCRRCDAHLGDIFNDGPKPTGLRYCIDSVALRFVKTT